MLPDILPKRPMKKFMGCESNLANMNIIKKYTIAKIVKMRESIGNPIDSPNKGFTRNKINGPCIKYIIYHDPQCMNDSDFPTICLSARTSCLYIACSKESVPASS